MTGEGGEGGVGGVGGSGGVAKVEWRVFVTTFGYTGNLGGLDGADAKCAAEAADAGLEGEFRAWLSTIDSPVSGRLFQAPGPYVLVNGTMIAEDWDDLVDGSILAFINLDADGIPRQGEAWTGTLANGGSYPDDDCLGFETESTMEVGLCGRTQSTTATWTENITPSCDTRLRLYCVEQ